MIFSIRIILVSYNKPCDYDENFLIPRLEKRGFHPGDFLSTYGCFLNSIEVLISFRNFRTKNTLSLLLYFSFARVTVYREKK